MAFTFNFFKRSRARAMLNLLESATPAYNVPMAGLRQKEASASAKGKASKKVYLV